MGTSPRVALATLACLLLAPSVEAAWIIEATMEPLARRLGQVPSGAPEGTRGGGGGARANQYRRDLNGDLHQLEACAQAVIPEGHTIVSYSCGGGGYGPPIDRPAEKVAHDVRERWVSVEAAKDIFGVVVSSAGVIDERATEALRVAQSAS